MLTAMADVPCRVSDMILPIPMGGSHLELLTLIHLMHRRDTGISDGQKVYKDVPPVDT